MNNRYRNVPSLRGPTKATASTLCQKCLKRDMSLHRPYQARPSRTQQLQNPNLRPKLSTEVPNDLLQTKGLADELLAKREEERGRRTDRDVSEPPGGQGQIPKRARSESSHSMSSISTISTNRSHSQSPPRHNGGHNRTGSVSSRHSRARKRRYSDSSGNPVSSHSSDERLHSQSHEWTCDRNTRRRRQESSPGERGRPTNLSRNAGQRDRSRSRSRDRGLIAKGRRSMTPETSNGRNYPRGSRDGKGPPESAHNYNRRPRHEPDHPAAQPRRERSLSPFSQRLALTQAMNIGK